MSQRTIVEFNHDYVHEISNDPAAFVQLVRQALNSGHRDEWERLRRFGLRKAVQCHHSDERKAVVNNHDYPLP